MFFLKKIYFAFLLLLLATASIVSEPVIVDWLGSEEGMSAEPKWLWKYVDENNDSLLRKRFKLKKNDLFFMGTAESAFMDESVKAADVKAVSMATARLKKECGVAAASAVVVSALERRFVFWQKISDSEDEISGDSYCKGYVLYVISAENWENLKVRCK